MEDRDVTPGRPDAPSPPAAEAAGQGPRPLIEIRGLSKKFGGVTAVETLDLDIHDQEFLALLGPSGCGKTTLLRMIGGFEQPTTGTISLEGKDMTGIAPNHRPVNMVFQSYAIFPHMTVAQNVGYGLKVTGVPKAETAERVREMLDLVQLGEMAGRLPDQLSGGQRQRVALARALVKRPTLLLLDEPLSALDANLREIMQVELVRIQKKVGITFIIVTHDQDEALSIASRIVVMNRGRICQDATPTDLYEYPGSRFVAGFIGSMNLFEVSLLSAGRDQVTVSDERLGELTVPVPGGVRDGVAPGQSIGLAVRPEKIGVFESRPGDDALLAHRAQVTNVAYHGNESHVRARLENGAEVVALVPNTRRGEEDYSVGEDVWVGWLPTDFLVLFE